MGVGTVTNEPIVVPKLVEARMFIYNWTFYIILMYILALLYGSECWAMRKTDEQS